MSCTWISAARTASRTASALMRWASRCASVAARSVCSSSTAQSRSGQSPGAARAASAARRAAAAGSAGPPPGPVVPVVPVDRRHLRRDGHRQQNHDRNERQHSLQVSLIHDHGVQILFALADVIADDPDFEQQVGIANPIAPSFEFLLSTFAGLLATSTSPVPGPRSSAPRGDTRPVRRSGGRAGPTPRDRPRPPARNPDRPPTSGAFMSSTSSSSVCSKWPSSAVSSTRSRVRSGLTAGFSDVAEIEVGSRGPSR